MPVIVSLLRGVNVGGRHKIQMESLRALYESLGRRDPRSWVQSGNVVFTTQERSLVRLARRIEKGIEQTFGFHADVLLRSASDLQGVAARNPFAAPRGVEPDKLVVLFLATDPAPEAEERIRRLKPDPEQVRIDGRHAYIYFPNGMGRSKLSLAALEKAFGAAGTARNWNTVTKLLEMATSPAVSR